MKVVASDGTSNEMFGYSVAIYDIISVVGAVQDDDMGLNSGIIEQFVNINM